MGAKVQVTAGSRGAEVGKVCQGGERVGGGRGLKGSMSKDQGNWREDPKQ